MGEQKQGGQRLSGHHPGSQKGVVTGLVARGQLARAPRVAKEPRGPRAKREESFVVRIYVIGGVGVRELHID